MKSSHDFGNMTCSRRRGIMLQTVVVYLAVHILFIVDVYGCPKGCTCTMKYSGLNANCAYGSFRFVPTGLPSNLSRLTLSANAITALQQNSFIDVCGVSSLWLAHNEISTVQQGTFASLVELKSLDLSNNLIENFPWDDLANLTNLNLLKMDNNRLASLPKEAFSGLKNLRSLQLDNNRLTTIVKGTFDSLGLLSNLQIHNNLFNCTCPLVWLKEWTSNTTVSVAEQESIVCATPYRFKGIPLGKIADLQCAAPSVQLIYHPKLNTNDLQEGLRLLLHCNATGNPLPIIKWKIQATKNEICDFTFDSERRRSNELGSRDSYKTDRYVVFPNRTLAILSVNKGSEGVYTCAATNELGSSEDSVEVSITGSRGNRNLDVKMHAGNTTGMPWDGEVVVVSLPDEDDKGNRGKSFLKGSMWIWMVTTFILIL